MNRYFSLRLLAIHALGAVSVLACLALANWQWERAQAYVPPANASQKTFEELSPLRDYLPASSVGVPTSVTGTWQPDERILMPERIIDGKSMVNPDPKSVVIAEFVPPVGYWVVDIMELADESSLGVVRGFTETPDQIALANGKATAATFNQDGFPFLSEIVAIDSRINQGIKDILPKSFPPKALLCFTPEGKSAITLSFIYKKEYDCCNYLFCNGRNAQYGRCGSCQSNE